ncbi:hypothetical protein CB1_000627009 [Camelus ferus]|nr:hypothetical protein CB1_000627009 [Camelus ferus]
MKRESYSSINNSSVSFMLTKQNATDHELDSFQDWAAVERDLKRKHGKLQQLEEQTKRLQKDMKKTAKNHPITFKSAVKMFLDLRLNPLCLQDQDFLNMVTTLDITMKWMDIPSTRKR